MLVINVVLLVAAIGLAVKLRGDWLRASRRYAVLGAATPTPPAAAPAPAVLAADWEVIAQRNLFSPDRNNELPKSAVEKPPPEPIVIGIINLGPGKKLALMSDASPRADSAPRQVKEGETFGGFRLLSIGDNEVEIEYQGQKKKLDVYTSAQQVPAPPPAPASAPQVQVVSTAGANPAAASSNATNTIPLSATEGPTNIPIEGTDSVFGHKDNLPAGTIRGNRRKVERITPFGKEVWWELIKPEEKKP